MARRVRCLRRASGGLLVTMLVGVLLPASAVAEVPVAEGDPESPNRIFEARILPIFRSQKRSSCVQCHLGPVDLKDYILSSHEETFRSLRDQGLLDLERPGKSRILRLINKRPQEKRPQEKGGADLVHESTRKVELESFTAWIEVSVKDRKLRNARPLDRSKLAKPKIPDEVIRHGLLDGLVESFSRKVWSLRFRCDSCHTDSGSRYPKLVEKYGAEKLGWLKPGPRATLLALVERELVSFEKPEESELLLKPLNITEHGGEQKMFLDDTDHMAFLGWLRDYAAIVKGRYPSAESLPRRSTYTGSAFFLRVAHVPAGWKKKTGMLTVHAPKPGAEGQWQDRPAAVSSFVMLRSRKLGDYAQGYLMIDSQKTDSPALPSGKFLVKMHHDKGKRTGTDFDTVIANSRVVGSGVVDARWQTGFRRATVVRDASFVKSQLSDAPDSTNPEAKRTEAPVPRERR